MGHLEKGGTAQRHSERRKKSLFRCALELGIYSIHEKNYERETISYVIIAIRFPIMFTTGYFSLDTARFGVVTALFDFWLNPYYLYVGGFGIGSLSTIFCVLWPSLYPRYLHSQKDLQSIIWHLFLHFTATFPYHLPATLFRTTFSPSLFF